MPRRRGYGFWTFGWIEAERRAKARQKTETEIKADKDYENKVQFWTWVILGGFGILIFLEAVFGIFK
jgi:hypothetical protein